jgi:hypothetical protein
MYEPDVAEFSNVRADVRRALVDLGVTPESRLVATTVLLANELASNAITHARTPFTVALVSTHFGVRIEAGDGSPAMPMEPECLDSSGRRPGLTLVRQFSSAWGVDRDSDGKTVWSVIHH